jgi:ribosomal protein L29
MTKKTEKKTTNPTTGTVAELKTQIFNLKFNKHTSGIEKPHKIKALKKEIARILTKQNATK